MRMKFHFAIILLICVANAFGQETVQELPETNKNNRIALSDIIGDWYLCDSINSKITFINRGNVDVILEGKSNSANDYCFKLDGDSIDVKGIAANWPPYYCTLLLYDHYILEIKVYQSHTLDTATYRYKKLD